MLSDEKINVNNFADLYNWTGVGRAAFSMTAQSKTFIRRFEPILLVCCRAHRGFTGGSLLALLVVCTQPSKC